MVSQLTRLGVPDADECMEICHVCPFRDKSGCTKLDVSIHNLALSYTCPEDLWPKRNTEIEGVDGYTVDDNGTVKKDGVVVKLCTNCKHRRVNVTWTSPPTTTPYCLLINSLVEWKTCDGCKEREE